MILVPYNALNRTSKQCFLDLKLEKMQDAKN